jgi:peptidoglycan hydrolase CwlO-like protein
MTSQLTTIQQQLAAVHQSWQDQQQQLTDQKSQQGELTEALEDTETRFRNVTKSLAIQTTELANERQEK